jgi:hypothetical protein
MVQHRHQRCFDDRLVEASIDHRNITRRADDYAVLQAIKQAIPDASSRSPTEVLEYVRDTLRAADAKVVEDCTEKPAVMPT